jgi:flagellar hook protein FlgE
MGSFSSPLSGLTAAQANLQSVSNNLANIDTDGYKDQSLTFSDVFSQSGATNGSGDPVQTGSGVAISSTATDFSEGALDTTGTASNMAISGNGFFITRSATGLQDYTRAGDFTTNGSGQLVTPNGELVLGYPATGGVVDTSAALQPLQVGGLTSPAVASTTVGITANLDSATPVEVNNSAYTGSAAVTDATTLTAGQTITITDTSTGKTLTVTGGATSAAAGSGTVWTATAANVGDLNTTIASVFGSDNSGITASDSTGSEVFSSTIDGLTVTQSGTDLGTIKETTTPSSAATGSTASSTLSIYDSLGTAHTLTVTCTKTAANTWNYAVTVPSADIVGGTGTSATVGSGTLNFDSSGMLTSMSNVIPISISNLEDGAAAMTISGPFGTAANPTITQTSLASATSATSTDGLASGTLTSYNVNTDGTIDGTFSSGKTLALGQVAVASFANTQGLVNASNNNLEPTAASGPAVIGIAGTGGRGTIIGGSVEQSNVDIAAEFSKLIQAQQAYSANAKSVTTFNQLSQATLAMLQ